MRRRGAATVEATADGPVRIARACGSLRGRLGVRVRRADVVALGILAGCGYQPGSYAWTQGAFAGERATVGCIDVAVERRPDASIGPVLRYQFANRCDHLSTVDLGAVPVVGRTADGAESALEPYDPRSELREAALDGRSVGSESLAYRANEPIAQLCVDLAALAHEAASRWVCIGAASSGAASSGGASSGAASSSAASSGGASSGGASSGGASSGGGAASGGGAVSGAGAAGGPDRVDGAGVSGGAGAALDAGGTP